VDKVYFNVGLMHGFGFVDTLSIELKNL